MSHHHASLTVSQSEAERLESQTTKRLLSSKKLSLIVDLDQTIVHATVDPTVAEWLKDPSNPNYPALKNVGKFKLGADGSIITQPILQMDVEEEVGSTTPEPEESADGGCWYYIKQRPGLQDFLQAVGERYEMHVYTMGTRSYAEAVCRIIDPTGRFFGGRILSRDERGSAGSAFIVYQLI